MSTRNSQAELFGEMHEDVPAAVDALCKRILVPYPVDKAYDYIVPDDLELSVGDYVCVPVRGKDIPGVVWGESAGDISPARLKSVITQYP